VVPLQRPAKCFLKFVLPCSWQFLDPPRISAIGKRCEVCGADFCLRGWCRQVQGFVWP
jgi:hypothetical protein